MPNRPSPKLKAFLSPAGAGIVLISFFLPWVRVSCGGKEMMVSGSSLGGIFWLVLGASIVSLLAFFYFRRRNKIRNARPFLLASAILAASAIVYKYISVMKDPGIPFYIPSSAIKVSFKIGAFGTIIGLMLIAAGSIFLEPGSGKAGNKYHWKRDTAKEHIYE